MGGIGNKLREARQQWQLTLREVEERSSRLALQWENPAYRISASWLDRVEREDRGLSATKLIVLAVVYGLTADQMIALCPAPNGNSIQALEQISAPNATLLLSLNSFSLYKGIENVYSLANYRDIFSDFYFHEIFLRTLRIAVLVTGLSALLGVPEARQTLVRIRARLP